MKDNIQDMVKETIEDTPLGGKSLSSILQKNTLDAPAKGLSSLLSNEIGKPISQTKTQFQQITTEYYPTDASINNEFLRLERQKNEKLTQTLETLSELPQQIEGLQKKLEDLTHFEEMNKLDQDINVEITKTRFELIKEKRNYLYVVMAICLLFGMVLGPLLFSEPKTVTIQAPAKINTEIKAIKKLDQYVTTKFVNIRDLNSPKSKVLMTISPNQVLTKLDQKKGWIKLEYTDHLKGRKVQGWGWHENLKLLTSP
ncbi:hypothetical protein [Halobacteriovorax sp. HLS]|uniref:hypothetical protein n=1 Tax=Halobacteriovorax sp. HLS TaxID=2234000 RepID=UPI000FD9485C|nr:hypothetical protein [Halobacteriovorax sp. HLS]